MKKLLLLFWLPCLSFNLNAQIKTKVLSLDLSKPKSETLKSSDSTDKRLVFWSKEPLQFQLVNGNPFRYKYIINNKVVNFFEDQSNNPISNIEKVLNAATPKNTASKPAIANPEADQKIRQKQSEIKVFQTQMNQDSTAGDNKSLKSNNNRLFQLKSELKTIIENTYTAKSTASYRFLNASGNEVTYPKTEEDDQNIVVDALSVIKLTIEQLYDSMANDEMVFRSDDDFNFETFKTKRTDHNNKYQKVLQDYLSIKSDVKKFTKPTEAIQNTMTDLEATIIKMNEKIGLFFSIRKENYIMPIDVNGKNIDVVEITVKRFELNSLIPEEFNYNIWVKGGFKIDISGGVYITSLVDKEYTSKNAPGTTTGGKVIFEKEKGNYDFGFGSAINISHRSAGWLNPTLNVGALFTANQKFQLLTGLGLILGKQERIIFSGGLSMGRIDSLAQNMTADGVTVYDIGEGGQVPTQSVFSFGGYFGITYNFSKTKKQTPGN